MTVDPLRDEIEREAQEIAAGFTFLKLGENLGPGHLRSLERMHGWPEGAIVEARWSSEGKIEARMAHTVETVNFMIRKGV